MPLIPANINGVRVEFDHTVIRDVDQRMVDGLKYCIKPQVASGHALSTIYISSANDKHVLPSRHMQRKAVDISRINGIKIVIGYSQVDAITAIVDAIQGSFENYHAKRENFGPQLKKKLGVVWPVSGHNDHIHLSVN